MAVSQNANDFGIRKTSTLQALKSKDKCPDTDSEF